MGTCPRVWLEIPGSLVGVSQAALLRIELREETRISVCGFCVEPAHRDCSFAREITVGKLYGARGLEPEELSLPFIPASAFSAVDSNFS